MKGIELLPQGHKQLYTCLMDCERAEEFEDETYLFAEQEEFEVGETFDADIYYADGGSVCIEDGSVYPIEPDCSCNGKCKNEGFSVKRLGIATFKVLNGEYDLEVTNYVNIKKNDNTRNI